VVDLGCGAGQNTVALARAGAAVTGVDFSDNQLDEGRKRAKELEISIEFINSDISNLSALSNDDFDLALSACAMAYVKDLKAALAETFRILKSGGRFVLSVMHPVQYIIDGEEI
jgi:ubiquinone/menaquinone biosynthesis C-methylase UbiE